MAKKTKKQAFTIVELVIVIAVIAILAAILIPTYSNLVKKANEATALVDAKNLITEMLADILSGDKDAADLIVFSKKGDHVFLYGYDASRGMVFSYKEMPLKDFDKNITVSDGHEFYNMAASFCKKMIGTDIKEISVPENDWRDPKVLNIGTADIKCTVEELGFDKNTMAVFANYEILDGFAKKSSGGDDPVHTHDWGDPTYNWTDDYSKCTAKRVCKVASCIENETETVDSNHIISQEQSCVNDEMTKYTAAFENSAFTTQTKEVKTKDKLGHKYKYEKLNDTHHKVTCERCDYNENEAHDGATSCSKCGWAKAEVTISLNKTSLTLKFGDTETLIATVTPAGTAVTWETSNSSVATVDGNGTVKAVSNGTAIITAKAGDKAAECTVTVTDKWEIKDGLLYHNDEKYTGKNPSDVGEKGLYYVDGALASGDVDGYKFRNGMLVVEDPLTASNVTSNQYGGTRTSNQTFKISGIDAKYVTDKLVMDITDIFIAKYKIDISAYKVASAHAKVPFAELLRKNGWTIEDCKKLVNDTARAKFTADYNAGNNFYCYPSDIFNEEKMYLPYINLTDDFIAYLNVLGYDVSDSMNTATTQAVEEYISRATGNGEVLPLTYAQYLELKYVKGIQISKSDDGSYITGAPASLTFDENHVPEPNSGTYSIIVGKYFIALVLDYNGNPYLNQNGTGVGGPYGGKFTVNSDNEITGFNETFSMDSITCTKSGNIYTFKHSNGSILTITTTKNEDGTTTFVMKSGSDTATAVWTPSVAGKTITTDSDGRLELSEYALTGDIYGHLNSSQMGTFISSVFNTGSGNRKSNYVHCEPAVVEAYIKTMNALSNVVIEGNNYSYTENGVVDITSAIKIGADGTIETEFPESQGSDLLYPDVEIILEKVTG